jgi:tRNA (cytidine56-2'-O)-methyltransferase
MYGMPIMEKISAMRESGRILIIVGSEQVPAEIYHLADHNISITSQPHSEVAALAIALDRLTGGRELESGTRAADFHGKISIIPSERGKDVRGLL